MIKQNKAKRIHDTLAPKIFTARFLLSANALLWLGFTIYIGVDMFKAQNTTYVIFLACFFLLLNAGAMFGCGAWLGKRQPWAYFLTLSVLVLNGFFTRVGQFEVFNLIAFVADLLIFIFLLTFGRAYVQST
ncbi:MAG: hypothetical protein IT310_14735 [Anaerolineales bacterium]|nr:hypothetical protein [Anaerolineales bacterium]